MIRLEITVAEYLLTRLKEIRWTTSLAYREILSWVSSTRYFCQITHELVDEIHTMSPKLTLEVYDFVKNPQEVKKYSIDKIPAIALAGENDTGIRFHGIPAGYEFTTLIEDLIDVSQCDPKLGEPMKTQLAKITQPVHLQVMISPSLLPADFSLPLKG